MRKDIFIFIDKSSIFCFAVKLGYIKSLTKSIYRIINKRGNYEFN